ncbi:MAG: hypothetical protein PHR16_04575 [Methylovulum sp.]|nr:hypothetical protein [Methylovulum sp.]
MKRSYLTPTAFNQSSFKELSRKTAIHEAGHAAAIYLGNKQKQLPPVFFQIFIVGKDAVLQKAKVHSPWIASIQGGRLIHTLPRSVEETTDNFSPAQKQAYIHAFEADMVNLLVGPLAEANYVALRDDEIINASLVNLNALHNYGGTADLQVVEDYLNCWSTDETLRKQKIAELFAQAFEFINQRANWRAINALANAILANNKQIFDCEEIIAVLDAHFFDGKKSTLRMA